MTATECDLALYAHAVKEALIGLREGGIPIGAALASGTKLLGSGHNRRIQHNDPTAHAEVDCLRSIGRLQTYQGTTLYTTLTPCFMCSGTIVLFRIPRVVIGQTKTYDGEGSLEFLRSHGIEVVDLNDETSIRILENYIAQHRETWLEDIGQLG